MTYLEALQWANETLRASGPDAAFASPMLDAELLLAAAVQAPRGKLFLRFDWPLEPAQEEKFRVLVGRRQTHEPIAYILGKKSFRKFDFIVNPSVLIPRPATETLVEAAISLGRNSQLPTANYQLPLPPLFADIGTGSGAIAISLAKETGCHVIATDLSREALAVAEENAKANGIEDLVEFLAGDGLRPLLRAPLLSKEGLGVVAGGSRPDHLILCANLPYLPDTRWDVLAPDIRLFEPKSALLGGVDGLKFYVDLFRDLRASRAALPPKLDVVIEIDPVQPAAASALIRQNFPTAKIEILKDLEGFDRVVVAKEI